MIILTENFSSSIGVKVSVTVYIAVLSELTRKKIVYRAAKA